MLRSDRSVPAKNPVGYRSVTDQFSPSLLTNVRRKTNAKGAKSSSCHSRDSFPRRRSNGHILNSWQDNGSWSNRDNRQGAGVLDISVYLNADISGRICSHGPCFVSVITSPWLPLDHFRSRQRAAIVSKARASATSCTRPACTTWREDASIARGTSCSGCSDNGGAFNEMLADRRGCSSCRIIDTIPEPPINDLAVINSGNALTSRVSTLVWMKSCDWHYPGRSDRCKIEDCHRASYCVLHHFLCLCLSPQSGISVQRKCNVINGVKLTVRRSPLRVKCI